MNKKTLIIILLIAVGLVALVGWAYSESTPKPDPAKDEFAKCLTDKKVVMYGAYWCSHCQNQKKLFGPSFQYINYVECTNEVNVCQEKNIKGYPTWIFEDGTRIEGEASFTQLGEKSSCEVPH